MTFAQIIGHEQQKQILRRALGSDRLAHAYLFEGPEGVGKRLMALALVRALFCLQGSGCGSCSACRKVDHFNHPDLHTLEPDGQFIKIEQVRGIQKELAYRPLEAKKKVCILDGAERLHPAAGNALLKTLEEPAQGTLFILLTPRPDGVLRTIRSRCQRLPFGRLPQELLERLLQDKLQVEAAHSHVLAALSEGSLKKALGQDRELYLQERVQLLKALTALSAGSQIPLFELAEKLAEDKERLPDILDILQAFYRDLLLLLQGRPQSELVNIDLLDKLQRTAARETTASLLPKLEAIGACRQALERNVNKQLALDVLLMRLVA
jgi:DNA polymerase III subunit delta'